MLGFFGDIFMGFDFRKERKIRREYLKYYKNKFLDILKELFKFFDQFIEWLFQLFIFLINWEIQLEDESLNVLNG